MKRYKLDGSKYVDEFQRVWNLTRHNDVVKWDLIGSIDKLPNDFKYEEFHW